MDLEALETAAARQELRLTRLAQVEGHDDRDVCIDCDQIVSFVTLDDGDTAWVDQDGSEGCTKDDGDWCRHEPILH